MTRTMRQTEACSSFVRIQHGCSRSKALFRCSCGSPFSSQLVIYRRFVTPLDVWYWRKRYPPASVWNDLGSHKPVRGGKRRAESTASIHSNNNPVTVIDYANPNHNPNPNLTDANAVDSAHLLPPQTGLWEPRSFHTDTGGYLLRQYQTSRGVTNRRYITSWDENGLAVDSVLDSLERKFILKEEQHLALHSFITTKKDVLAF